MLKTLLLCLGLCLMLSTPVWATRYWVATTGSDSNACSAIDGDADPGTYKLTPLSAQACLTVAGDRLTIKAGTYSGSSARIGLTTTAASGTTSNHTIIEGDPSDADGCALTSTCTTILRPSNTLNAVLLNGPSHMTIRKLRLDQVNSTPYYPLRIDVGTDILIVDVEGYNTATTGNSSSCMIAAYPTSFITFRRIHAHDCGVTGGHEDHGAYLQGDDLLVEDSSFHDNSSMGAQCYTAVSQSDGRADRCIFRRNKLYDNGDNGLVLEGNDDQAYDNEIYGNGSGGISAYNGLRNKLYNNLVYNNGSNGIVLGLFGASSNSEVKNNIVFGQITEVSITAGTVSVTQSNNACATGDACGTTGKLTITALTDCTVSTSVFTLKAVSSCIDAGTSVSTRSSANGTADIGPYEAVTFASCVVEDGDASTVRVTFTNNVAPPLLPAASPGTFTTRKATVANAVTASTVTGDTRVDLTVTNAIINGDAVDISWASGNLTASATVGGTTAQPYVTAITNQSCTNNVGAAAGHVFTQAAFEFHGLRGTEAAPVGTPYATAPENANIFVMVGGSVRLRLAVTCTTADCPPTGFFPRYSKNAGAYDTVVPDTYGVDNIAFCGTSQDPDIPNSGTATTDQLSTSGTFVAGALVRTSNAIPTVDMALNGKTELEYCFSFDTDATSTDTYDIRLYKQDGTALNTYTVTPRITVQSVSQGMGF